MNYCSFWRKLYHKLIGNKSIFKEGVKFGKKSFIDAHADILNGKYIYIGNNSHINDHCWLQCYTNLGTPSIHIWNNTIIGRNVTMNCSKNITIGDNCMIASYVLITDTNHGIDLNEGNYISQKNQAKSVFIGNNVWIGQNVVVLPGVSIGDNCIIGAGAIVTKSIDNNCLAVGNPAKVIKIYSFEQKKWIKCE